MKEIEIARLVVGPLQGNCYIVACPASRSAAIIDPGGDEEKISRRLESMGVTPLCIINTHAHPDHTAANASLKDRYGVPIWIHEDEAVLLTQSGMMGKLIGLFFPSSPPPDRLLRDGEELRIGSLRLTVLHTPGHSPGGICLFSPRRGEEAPVLFSGDTIFEDSIGRTDLPGGSYDTLMRSLNEKILCLPDDTRILPGHGPETTLGREKQYNPFLSGRG